MCATPPATSQPLRRDDGDCELVGSNVAAAARDPANTLAEHAAQHLAPPMSKSNSLTGRTPVSPILERGESQSPARPRTGGSGSQQSMPPPGHHRGVRAVDTPAPSRPRTLSEACSGSPSAPRTDWPDLSRTIYEDGEGELPAGAVPLLPLHAEPEPPAAPPHMVTSFSQPARSRHAPQSSQGSSHLSAPNGAPRKLSVDVRPPTPASATLYDEEFLDVIERATDVAFAVWLRLAEEIGISQPPFMHSKSDSMSSSGSVGSASLPTTQDDPRPSRCDSTQTSCPSFQPRSMSQPAARVVHGLAGQPVLLYQHDDSR
jgi:hypothetical protein